MSKYDFDKHIKKSDRLDRNNHPVGDDRVDLATYDACCADVANGFAAVDSFNAFTGANTLIPDCGAVHSLRGVNCEATNCKYHHPGGNCAATNITVEAPGADDKTETFCNTFKPNSGC